MTAAWNLHSRDYAWFFALCVSFQSLLVSRLMNFHSKKQNKSFDWAKPAPFNSVSNRMACPNGNCLKGTFLGLEFLIGSFDQIRLNNTALVNVRFKIDFVDKDASFETLLWAQKPYHHQKTAQSGRHIRQWAPFELLFHTASLGTFSWGLGKPIDTNAHFHSKIVTCSLASSILARASLIFFFSLHFWTLET